MARRAGALSRATAGPGVALVAVGITCGLGRGAAPVREALRHGRSGVRGSTGWPAGALPTDLAVEIPVSVPPLVGFPDDRKVALLADAAAQLPEIGALAPPSRRGVFLGTGLSSVTPRELAEDVYPHVRDGRLDRDAAMVDTSADRVAPRRHEPSRATAWLAGRLGACGPGGTSFSACAAAAEAIAEGMRAIRRGEADVVVAGGHDSMIHPLGMLSFQALGALAPGLGRPFDAHRDGFVLGEGAALVTLARADLVDHPLGYLRGAGSSLDAHGVTAPHPQGRGAEAAMRRALGDAGLAAPDVGWVNAHATGTRVGDLAEAKAIARVFGERGVPVSSLKGALGHGLAAAGALELVATVLAWQGAFTPGTVGCREPDPTLGADVLVQTRAGAAEVVVSNSFGFGGQNVSLVLERGV